jgi:Alginate export
MNPAAARLSATSSLLAAALGLGSPGLGVAQSNGDGTFKLSGSQRARYESISAQFRRTVPGPDQLVALKTSLTFDWRLPRLSVVAELLDSRAEANDAGSFLSTSTVDALEPVQAYVAWRRASAARADTYSVLRAGRMTLDLGKRRLLSRSGFGNTAQAFMGLDWEWHGADGALARALYVRPMDILPDDRAALLANDVALDHTTPRTSLTGGYYQWAPLADKSTIETYVLRYQRRPTTDPDFSSSDAADHMSFGARIYRAASAGQLNYEVEAVLQRGESGDSTRTDLKHRASLLHAEIGFEFDTRWAPNVALQYDHASGDSDPTDGVNERFDTLFGDRSFELGPTGLYGAAARGNLDTPGARLTFRPEPNWRWTVAYRRFRLAEARDAWVGSGYRDPTGAAGRSIGDHFEAGASWTPVPNRVTVDFGLAELTAGRFARGTAGSAFQGNPYYSYFGVTTTF